MKTLYISDLDGTLFTMKKKLTDKTVSLLSRSIEAGAYFSVATARMPYACDYRLERLRLSAPSILTNGVFLYDFENRAFLYTQPILPDAAQKALRVFDERGTGAFMFTQTEDKIALYYNDPALKEQTQYYSEKAIENCSEVKYVPDLAAAACGRTVTYIACTGEKNELEPLCSALEQLDGVSFAFYLNIYNSLYCLEVFSDQASKKNALLRLKKMCGFDEVVVFGDNLNDLSMFEVADRSYAVSNSLEIVKERATAVIGSCDDDGVAKFIYNEVIGE